MYETRVIVLSAANGSFRTNGHLLGFVCIHYIWRSRIQIAEEVPLRVGGARRVLPLLLCFSKPYHLNSSNSLYKRDTLLKQLFI